MIGPDFWLISNEMSAPYEENGHAAIYFFFLSFSGWLGTFFFALKVNGAGSALVFVVHDHQAFENIVHHHHGDEPHPDRNVGYAPFRCHALALSGNHY